LKIALVIFIFLSSLFFNQQVVARKKPQKTASKTVSKTVSKKPASKSVSRLKPILQKKNNNTNAPKKELPAKSHNKVNDSIIVTKKDTMAIDSFPKKKQNNSTNSSQSITYGAIKGVVYFPDTLNPKDLRVIAENLETHDTIASVPIESRKKNSYSLKLKSGKYHIYAYTNMLPNVKAYYTEWVVCKQEPWCYSHEKVIVNVTSGKTLEKINPVDWGDIGQE